jgi:hypothetical protein
MRLLDTPPHGGKHLACVCNSRLFVLGRHISESGLVQNLGHGVPDFGHSDPYREAFPVSAILTCAVGCAAARNRVRFRSLISMRAPEGRPLVNRAAPFLGRAHQSKVPACASAFRISTMKRSFGLR